MYPQTEIQMGDVLQVVGEVGDVAQAADEIGYTQVPSSFVDHVYLGCGMLVGILMGLVTVPVAGVPIGLGIGGGCLVSGLIFGWLRARKPTFGDLPAFGEVGPVRPPRDADLGNARIARRGGPGASGPA